VMRKPGRPPRRPVNGEPSSLTVKLPAAIKSALIDQAEAYDLSVTEYLCALVERDQVA
jgi:hypothetical protein